MEITLGYAIGMGGVILLLALINILPCLPFIIPPTWPLIQWGFRYLTYPYLLHRHRFIGPWTGMDIIIQLIYIASNSFCLGFQTSSIRQCGIRAGNLTLINLIPLFLGPHLSFLTDIFGVSLATIKLIHRYSGLVACSLMVFHVAAILASHTSFILHSAANISALVGASSLGLITLVSWPSFRRLPWPLFRLSYEIFLRFHHILAVALAISIILHVPSGFFPQVYFWITLGVFIAVLGLEWTVLLRRNGILTISDKRRYNPIISTGGKLPIVGEIYKDETQSNGPVSLTIILREPLEIQAGQYINVFIPSLGFRSMMQSHPFVVASWTGKRQTKLELIIEPCHGWTKRLHSRAISVSGHSGGLGIALFSGPHGIPVQVCNYGHHIMLASGYGIVALLPLLDRLVQGMQAHEAQARRICLAWEFNDEGLYNAVRPYLNLALAGDGDQGNNRALNLSLYTMAVKEGDLSKRARIFNCSMPLKAIVETEIAEVNNKEMQDRAMAEMVARRDMEINRVRTEQQENNHEDRTFTTKKAMLQEIQKGQGDSKPDSGTIHQLSLPVYTEKSRMLITVSASTSTRDELRSVLWPHLNKDITLKELDYQPADR